MSRTSCIRHPTEALFLKIYRWQIDFCEGNPCAAALMSYFEFCHNGKLQKVAQDNLLKPRAHALLQWHTYESLEKKVFFYKRDKISESIALLKDKGVIELHDNPNPADRFNRTRFFLFKPKVVNDWIDEHFVSDPPSSVGKSEMPGETGDLPSISGKPEMENRKIDHDLRKIDDQHTKNSPKNSDKETKTKSARDAEQPLNGHAAVNGESSSSFNRVAGDEEGAEEISQSPPVVTATPGQPSESRVAERATGSSVALEDSVRGAPEWEVTKKEGEPRDRDKLDPADDDDLANKIADEFKLSSAQRKIIRSHIAHSENGRAFVLKCALITQSEPRENVGRTFMAAFNGKWELPASTVKTSKRPAAGHGFASQQDPEPHQLPAPVAEGKQIAESLKAFRLSCLAPVS
jgi:hypothetical protein